MMTHAFNPDWTLAPAATLQDWMDENGFETERIHEFAVPTAGIYPDDMAVRLVSEVLDSKPLGTDHAICLALCTGIPNQTWLNLERNYRRDLANGLKDVTWA